jgi:hypothetical protein
MIETTPLISFPYLLYDSFLSLLAVALVRYLLPLLITKKKKKNYFPFSCFYARHIWTVPKLSSFLFHYYLLKIYNETHEAMSIEMPTGKGK